MALLQHVGGGRCAEFEGVVWSSTGGDIDMVVLAGNCVERARHFFGQAPHTLYSHLKVKKHIFFLAFQRSASEDLSSLLYKVEESLLQCLTLCFVQSLDCVEELHAVIDGQTPLIGCKVLIFKISVCNVVMQFEPVQESFNASSRTADCFALQYKGISLDILLSVRPEVRIPTFLDIYDDRVLRGLTRPCAFRSLFASPCDNLSALNSAFIQDYFSLHFFLTYARRFLKYCVLVQHWRTPNQWRSFRARRSYSAACVAAGRQVL